MSRASKLSMVGTGLFAAATIAFVHFQQQAEKAAMHEGVVRDMETQQRKKAEQAERQLDFQMQQALEAEYKRDQTVRSSLEPTPSNSNDSSSTTSR